MPTRRITAPVLERLKPGETVWDTEVRGFGARRQSAAGRATFVFKYVSPGHRRQRFMTIGQWGRGDWAIDDARKKATELRDAVRMGRDPAEDRDAKKGTPSVAELCDAYLLAAHNGDPRLLKRNGSSKKLTTLANDRGRIEAHITPLLGTFPVDRVARRDVETFMLRVAKGATAQRRKLGVRAVSVVQGGRGAASRTVGLLGAIFAYAQKLDLCTDNPCRGVTRFADQKRERRLTNKEYQSLAVGLTRAEAEGVNPAGIAAVRLLILTGWRRNEATDLQWAQVDLARRTARLGDTKTGASVRPLSRAAAELIAAQPRTSNPHVFPARVEGRPLQGLPRMWDRVRALSGLPRDVTLHVLRHSFASLAADLGYGDAAIAGLIGHKRGGITARYTHAADAVLLKVADEVARATLAELEGRGAEGMPSAEVVPLHAAI